MKNNLVNNIISILNANSTIDEKRANFRKEKARCRGKNRTILSIIIDLLSEYTLPLNFDDSFSIYSLDEITSKEYDILLEVANGSSCQYFNAVCFDILWEHYQKI